MKLIINSNQFIIEEHCKPLVWQRILVISWSMPRQKSLILQFFSGYTRERPFPLFSLLWRSTSWTEGFFLAHWSGLQLWVSATYHQGLRCTRHCVCVCVCMCVWAFLPSSAAGWHGIRTTTTHSDQNKPHFFFTTLAHRPAKQTNQG